MTALLHHKGRAPITDDRIRHLARNGTTITQLRKRLHVSAEWLRRKVIELGLGEKVRG